MPNTPLERMYHPTTRVLTVLELLQSHPQMSGVELAARLEVNPRTVRRYITMLQDLGIPVEAERGRHGAYRLRPGFKLPPLMFNEEEALALVLGLRVTQQLSLPMAATAVEGALAKVERVMPHALRTRLQALQQVLTVHMPSPYTPPAGEVVMVVSQAAQQGHRVWVRYHSWQGEETEREIDPYGVVFYNGRWFTAGYCHLRQDLRVFRLDRVAQVECRPETFAKPADFDPLAHVIASLATSPGTWAVEVLLKTTLAHARRCIPADMATLTETAEGVFLRCYVQQLEWFAHFLAGLGCDLVVHQPAELHQEICKLAAHLNNLTHGQ